MSNPRSDSVEPTQSCAACDGFEGSKCEIWQKPVAKEDGSDCVAFFPRELAEEQAIANRSEEIIRLWVAFQKSQNRGVDEPHLVPVFATGDERPFHRAFERFCELTQGKPKAIPLFLTLPDTAKPDRLPSQLVVDITRLGELSGLRDRVIGDTPAGGWAFFLLETCFPDSLARFDLDHSDSEFPGVEANRRRVVGELLDPKIALGADQSSGEQRGEFDGLDQHAIRAAEWEALFGDPAEGGIAVESDMAIGALSALVELHGSLDVLLLDDLIGRNTNDAFNPHNQLIRKLQALEPAIRVHAPVLPVHQRHEDQADELLPIIEAELAKLSRPLAAVVDLNWVFADTSVRSPRFGLELIRLLRKAKPSLPIFVWAPMRDKAVLQRAMQLGASSYFDKEEALSWRHEEQPEESAIDGLPGLDSPEWSKFNRRRQQAKVKNLLTFGKVWFRVLQWEMTRYRMPPVEGCGRSFLLDETRETRTERQKFLKTFDLTEAKLLAKEEPDVERLLRALVPDAEQVEILRFFGEGRSGSEPPFIVRGKTRSGRWLRPVQIKISKDWRALAREGKGYRDVFAGALGPSVAHVEAGPYRLNNWSGMCQSLAAPEEAIREIGTKSTRSLSEWLRKNLWKPEVCRQLVNELFDGVLDPFYKDNLEKKEESVIKAFDRVSPAHLETVFLAVEDETPKPSDIDLTPEILSRKNEKARREAAYRQCQKLEKWYAEEETAEGKESINVWGLVIDTLEVDDADPKEWRLRLLDRTLGVKIDLKAGDHDVARRWKALADSPIKLRGLPVAFCLKRELLNGAVGGTGRLLQGWGRSVIKKLTDAGIAEVPASENQAESNKLPKEVADRIAAFFYPIHPLDWTEEFHVGPTHGDLNLGNILLHQKGESFFPWLIDFDKAEVNRPVVFDLAKLEIEAYHKIGHELYWELAELGCSGTTTKERDERLRELLRDFENCLEREGIETIVHLWERFEKKEFVPESLRLRFEGFFAYLSQVHERIEKLGITRREFLIGRTVYCFCCIKFKHLYEAKSHPNAPFPAKLLAWKLEALLDALDAMNGIPQDSKGLGPQAALIRQTIDALRKARIQGSNNTAKDVLSAEEKKWIDLFKALRDKTLSGEQLWFREVLWHARDCGVARTSLHLADFTRAIAVASTKDGKPESLARFAHIATTLKDFASTGRMGNVYPTREMFRVLAETDEHLIKISSRGESGGTIDILEQAGVPLCKTASAVEAELKARGWAVASASKDICEVDKILWGLRKQTNCMKVGDLVIASISAKKLALGIGSFDVEVATGYDSKIPEPAEYLGGKMIKKKPAQVDLKAWWSDVWKCVLKSSGGGSRTGKVGISYFDTNHMKSWFEERVGTPKKTTPDLVVMGSAMLAASIWRLNPDWHPRLRLRLPAEFCQRMDQYAKLLVQIRNEATREWSGNGDRASAKGKTKGQKKEPRPIFRLSDIDRPPELQKVICWSVDDLDSDCEQMKDIRVIFFRFDTKAAGPILERINIPFFDALYSEMSRRGANELTSFILSNEWLAMLLPKATFCSLDFSQCWRVLRDGFAEPPR